MKKVARLFSGFDGAGEGIRASGFDLAWAIEWDSKISAVARMNGHNVITADILDVDPAAMEPVWGLHASPVCTNASVANSSAEVNEDGTKEAQLDIDCAMKTVRFVEVLRPRLFTLENVWQYRNFQSFSGGARCEGILPALKRLGYRVAYWHINAADYGVPQTRRRLILVASLDFVPEKPWETHYDPARPDLAAPSLFNTRAPWVGWYEAIEDLIPTLPESQFAPWQLARLPEEMKEFIIGNGDRSIPAGIKEPMNTITANRNQRSLRAFLVNTREMHGNDGAPYTSVGMREPCYTVPATSAASRHKAFLVNGALSGEGIKTLQIHNAEEPTGTIVASINNVKDTRAWLSRGRVVKMTPRCLARFQSFSDTYKLSGNNALDCKGIGNACPPRLFREIYGQIRSKL